MRGRPIAYSADELRWIEANRNLPRRQAHAQFVARFGREDVKSSAYAALCKRKGWLTGRSGRYEKGNRPDNKGKSMPYNANSARTRFRPGQLPANWRGAGHESIDGEGYVWVIIDAPNPYTGGATRRIQKHRLLWEQANGPVPEGHVLKCLDGDKTHCDPANWTLIPMALLPRLNGRFGRNYDTAPAPLKPVIMATARLEHKAREARK